MIGFVNQRTGNADLDERFIPCRASIPSDYKQFPFCTIESETHVSPDRLTRIGYQFVKEAHQIVPEIDLPYSLFMLAPRSYDGRRVRSDVLNANPGLHFRVRVKRHDR